ncbi:hypothetical protein [Caballeronia sp. S22]|uniref:hypothetical protein n=1 Tax=Caballeronia sp. S22 TaxID=3137182 RepID=UPI0035311F3D
MTQSKRRLKKKLQAAGLDMMVAATERMNLYDDELRDAFNGNVSGELSTRTVQDVPKGHMSKKARSLRNRRT